MAAQIGKKGGDISFQSFPHKNSEILKLWVQAIQRQVWSPKDHGLICSIHFKDSSFVVRPGKKGRKLKENAVTTEFPAFPNHMQRKTQEK